MENIFNIILKKYSGKIHMQKNILYKGYKIKREYYNFSVGKKKSIKLCYSFEYMSLKWVCNENCYFYFLIY